MSTEGEGTKVHRRYGAPSWVLRRCLTSLLTKNSLRGPWNYLKVILKHFKNKMTEKMLNQIIIPFSNQGKLSVKLEGTKQNKYLYSSRGKLSFYSINIILKFKVSLTRNYSTKWNRLINNYLIHKQIINQITCVHWFEPDFDLLTVWASI